MFEPLSIRDVKPIAILKKLFVLTIVGLLGIGAVSSYRAYVQVRSLEITSAKKLTAGSEVNVVVTTSGRTTIDVKVALLQGDYSETLFVMNVRGNELGFFDPRPRHANQTAVLSLDRLERFRSGSAILRAVAIGRPQWMRLPPPTVREFAVEIQKD